MKFFHFFSSLVFAFVVIPTLEARNIASWDLHANSPTAYSSTIISGAGHTHAVIPSLTGINTVSELEEIWIFNPSNSGYPNFGSAANTAIADFVANGGRLYFFDRRVTEAASMLPGASGIVFVRGTGSSPSNANLIDLDPGAPALLVAGLNNQTFDGGNSSSHGFMQRSSLPANAQTVLIRQQNSEHVVQVVYPYGSGMVCYSTIPADHYLSRGSSSIGTGLQTMLANAANNALARTAMVATTAVSSITSSSATAGGNITTTGGAVVTERGVVFSTNPNPTLASGTKVVSGSGTGSFTANLSALMPSTTYYVRAYAINSAGTAYGSQVIFTTNPAIPSISTAAATAIGLHTATSGGSVLTVGQSAVTERGVVFSTNPNPTLASGTKVVSGSGTGGFTANLAGLLSNTTYYLRAYASNSVGTGYGANRSFTTLARADLALRSSDVVIDPALPVPGEPWTVTTTVFNQGDAAADAELVIFLRQPGGNMAEAARIPVDSIAPGGQRELVWYAPALLKSGPHQVELELQTISPSDVVTGNNAVGPFDFQTGAPPLRLEWLTAEGAAAPGDSRILSFAIRNTGSEAVPIDAVNVAGGPAWLNFAGALPAEPLAPGEEWFATFALDVPAGATPGTLESPNLSTFLLQASSGGNDFQSEFILGLYPANAASIEVTVVNATSNMPIAGAIVAVDDSTAALTTGADGKVVATLLPGTRTVAAYGAGFLPDQAVLQIEPGPANALTLALQAGEPLGISEVSSTALSAEEIAARGIDLEDPENSIVYDFQLSTSIDVLVLKNVVVGSGGGSGQVDLGDYSVSYEMFVPGDDPFERVEVWVITPGKVQMLKQFWDVAVSIGNQTSAFVIEDTALELDLPAGLSLPELFGSAQAANQVFGDLAPGETVTGEWVVRGDLPGNYQVPANATGDLKLGALSIPLVGGGSAEIEVTEPRIRVSAVPSVPEVFEGESFELLVSVENLSPVPLNGVEIALDPLRIENAEVVVGETLNRVIGTIPAEGEATVAFELIPIVPAPLSVLAALDVKGESQSKDDPLVTPMSDPKKFVISIPPLPDQQTAMTTSLGVTLSEALPAINFEPALEAALRDILNKPTGDITADDLVGIIGMDLSGRGISDLSGLENAVDLENLNLSNNSITDVSLLEDFPSLASINLNGNPLDFLDPTLRSFLQSLVSGGVIWTPITQSITFELDEGASYAQGQAIPLSATSSISGLVVSLALSDDSMGLLAAGTLTLANDASGPLTVTASQSGDEWIAAAEVVERSLLVRPFFDGPYTVSTRYETPVSISLVKLLARVAVPDGGLAQITTLSPTDIPGATATLGADSIQYLPAVGFSGEDRFMVTIGDGLGGSTTGTVIITVGPSQNSGEPGVNPAQIEILPEGDVGIAFQGIPGRQYIIQRSLDLSTGSWQDLATVTAAPNGSVAFTDQDPPVGSAFYRLRMP